MKIVSMTLFDPGEVILVRFPFTDLSGSKRRPAAVLSPTDFSKRYGDVVVLALTSRSQEDDSFRLDDWRDAGLLKPTWVKPIVVTISLSLTEGRLGMLSSRDRRRAMSIVNSIILRDY